MSSNTFEDKLEIKRHIKYFERCLQVLPGRYGSLDTNRLTIAFFGISGLDLLEAVDQVNVNKHHVIEWIYSLQVLPVEKNGVLDMSSCGFRGGAMNGASADGTSQDILYDSGHLAMTYTALCSLLILGDDLSRLNRQAIAYGLKNLQLDDGSFQFCVEGSECDMRFVYCVACICYIINDFTTIDIDSTVNYIMNSFTYEGSFGQGPFLESHGGSTFCAVASLFLFDRLDVLKPDQVESLKRWCHTRQQSGFQGRPNKPVDTCYSFWVGATLDLLGSFQHINKPANQTFLLSTQDTITGGFSKWPSHAPDPMHSYMGLAGFAMMNEPGLQKLHPALNISQRAADHLHKLHKQWL